MSNKIKLIFFDFDGTLCPISGDHILFEKEFIEFLKKKYSLDEITKKKRKEIKETMSHEEWENLKREARKLWMKTFEIPSEIKDSLTKLKNNFRLIIFSVASKKYIHEILENNNLDHLIFDKIYSTRDDFEGELSKEPWMFKEIAKREGLETSECAHIGDQEYNDYLNSKEAGFRAFLVDNGQPKPVKISELDKFLN